MRPLSLPLSPDSAGLAAVAAAALAFVLAPAQAQAATIANGSFEADTNYTNWPGYQTGNGGGANNGGVLSGWSSSNTGRTGLNANPAIFVPANTSPFVNNGTIPDGPRPHSSRATMPPPAFPRCSPAWCPGRRTVSQPT